MRKAEDVLRQSVTPMKQTTLTLAQALELLPRQFDGKVVVVNVALRDMVVEELERLYDVEVEYERLLNSIEG